MKQSINISTSLIVILAISAQSATATATAHTLIQHSLNVNSQHALVNKASECTNMIRVINQTVADTNAATNFGKNGDIQTIKALVKIFGKAARDIDSLNVSDEKLKTYRNQFSSMYQGGSEISKQLISSIKKINSIKTQENLRRSKNIFSPERDLTTGLNIYCRT
jgi:hypothetical protein